MSHSSPRLGAWRLASSLNHLASDLELLAAEIRDAELTPEELQQLHESRALLERSLARLVEHRERTLGGAE